MWEAKVVCTRVMGNKVLTNVGLSIIVHKELNVELIEFAYGVHLGTYTVHDLNS